ncbi:MAG TPA: flagellar filament capping protein FliD [Candidatus Dormibacteraeota bacterium]|nr:flagellar filament capping protein FliD [Candidatus Dormibacteraeota bacterium]
MSSTSVGGSILTGSQTNTSNGGLGAGINVSQLVSAAMANQTAELTIMQGQQTQISNEQTALTSFNNDLQTLQNSVYGLTDPVGQMTAIAASTSDPSILSATAMSGTASGTHTITVSNLATTSSAYSAAIASSSTALATGTLNIQVGSGAATPITIDNTNNTLDGLAQTINNTPNIGVSASVITDANGARLALVSNTSGQGGSLTVTPSSGLPTFTTAAGQNASLTVDGIPISSASNVVTGVLSGVTLNLAGANPNTSVTVSTGPDVTQQEAAVNSFVSAYNTVIGDLNSQFAIDPTTNQAGALASDGTLSLAQSQILSTVSFAMSGNGNVQSLAGLGVSMNNDGTLKVNNSALASALQSNPSAVQSFFQSGASGSLGANLSSIVSSIADPITGSVAQDLNGLSQTQTGLTQQISDFQTQMNTMQQQLTPEYVQVDTTLQQLPLMLQQISQQLQSLG